MGIKERLAAKKAGKSGKSNIRDKFQKRDQKTLEKAWEERDKRSGFGTGKSIFNEELMEELEIGEFKPDTQKEGVYYCEIMPVSYDPTEAYFIEVPIHQQVGMNNDNLVCTQRYALKGFQAPCFRCITQKQLYKESQGETTNEIKALFPRDRVIYLVWDRTEEFNNDAEPVYKLDIWNAPKEGVHSKLQSKVKNKRTQELIDISDVSKNGEGKTVYTEVEIRENVDKGTKKKQKFPQYEIDLLDREEPIPDEILEKLDFVIEELQKRMSKKHNNPLEVFIHFPEEGEMETAMATEVYSNNNDNGGESKKDDDDEVNALLEIDLEQLYEELTAMKSTFKMKRWIKENGLEDDIETQGKNAEELVDSIVEYIEALQDEAQ